MGPVMAEPTCRWPADGHAPSGSAGAPTSWPECGHPIHDDVYVSTPAAVTLFRLPVCDAHLVVARGVGWHVHLPLTPDETHRFVAPTVGPTGQLHVFVVVSVFTTESVIEAVHATRPDGAAIDAYRRLHHREPTYSHTYVHEATLLGERAHWVQADDPTGSGQNVDAIRRERNRRDWLDSLLDEVDRRHAAAELLARHGGPWADTPSAPTVTATAQRLLSRLANGNTEQAQGLYRIAMRKAVGTVNAGLSEQADHIDALNAAAAVLGLIVEPVQRVVDRG